jgi:hypothetical protein
MKHHALAAAPQAALRSNDERHVRLAKPECCLKARCSPDTAGVPSRGPSLDSLR